MKYKFEIHEKAIGKERPRYSSKHIECTHLKGQVHLKKK